jgi:hypothetical protein
MLPESISSPKSIHSFDLDPEPDLHPLYPSTPHIAVHLSSHSGLNPDQKAELVRHSLGRACAFAEISVLQYLFSDPQAQPYLDLTFRDDDGVGLVSLTIHGFGSDSERDIEREECVRLLVAQGADLGPDKGTCRAIIKFSDSFIKQSWMDSSSSCRTLVSTFSHFISHDPWMFAF